MTLRLDAYSAVLDEPMNKVPAITTLFWIIKVLTTGMGETTSDFLVRRFDPPLMVGLAGLILVASLWAQLRWSRYSRWRYWSVVVMVSIFGTMVADVIHVILGVPYPVSTLGFGVVLVAVLAIWHRREGTLSIHSITTTRREGFYWATVLATFAFGTALGDLSATSLTLGYLTSGVVFAVLFGIPLLAGHFVRANEVMMFWIAYILTRPLGASFADWAGVPHERGGLDFGTGWVSLALGAMILAAIALSARGTGGRSPADEARTGSRRTQP